MVLHIILIRLITLAAGGDGYLNFIGNEFGHPEWLDFPREGNNYSFYYARRQFNLASDENLHYFSLNLFDKSMIQLAKKYKILKDRCNFLLVNRGDKVICLKRNGLIFIFNFDLNRSYVDYKIVIDDIPTIYEVILNTDNEQFGGHNRIDEKTMITAVQETNSSSAFKVYLPSKTAFVLKQKS